MPYKDPEKARRHQREYNAAHRAQKSAYMKAHPEYNRNWKARNREKCREYNRKYHAEHREQIHARKSAYAKAHREEYTQRMREYRQRPGVKERNAAYMRERYWRNREKWLKYWHDSYVRRRDKCKAYQRQYRSMVNARCAVDAEYYSLVRAERRTRSAVKRIAMGKTYRPRFHTRLPDWCVMGQRVLDNRSAFLAVNMSASQRDYVRELAIERTASR